MKKDPVVLIVDDSIMKIGVLVKELKSNHQVVVLQAYTLPEAQRLFDLELPHCVVLDACMPAKLDTIPFLHHVRAHSKELPVIPNSSDSYYNRLLLEAGATVGFKEESFKAQAKQIADLAREFAATAT